MASSIQTIIDGPRNVVIKAVGTSAVTDELIVDVSALVPACTLVNIEQVDFRADAAVTAARLIWDATSDVIALELTQGGEKLDFSRFGGLTNNAGAGVTGDILLTTVGAGAYSVVLYMTKHGTIDADSY